MRRLKPWVSHAAYGVATVLLLWMLYRGACTTGRFSLASLAEILVVSFCLTKLSYLVFPRGWLKRGSK